ncbi:hypothetical protein ACFYY1_38210 [Streptomyces sp. NPDC001890]|uniref:hypothetical protein n=1 Tax=Streptomyces sp. NPDC001890 TaxID=3364620 RepID=UPI0036C66D0A
MDLPSEAASAIAPFSDKYGDTVRIVDIGDFSRELCGSTHAAHGSQVGALRLLSESSIGSNLRRDEALTGHGTLRRLDTEPRLLNELGRPARHPPRRGPGVQRQRLDALVTAQQQLTRLRAEELRHQARHLAAQAQPTGHGQMVAQPVTGVAPDGLRPRSRHPRASRPRSGHGDPRDRTRRQGPPGRRDSTRSPPGRGRLQPDPRPGGPNSRRRLRKAVVPSQRRRVPPKPSARPWTLQPRMPPACSATTR